jgi:hypothetical protein
MITAWRFSIVLRFSITFISITGLCEYISNTWVICVKGVMEILGWYVKSISLITGDASACEEVRDIGTFGYVFVIYIVE